MMVWEAYVCVCVWIHPIYTPANHISIEWFSIDSTFTFGRLRMCCILFALQENTKSLQLQIIWPISISLSNKLNSIGVLLLKSKYLNQCRKNRNLIEPHVEQIDRVHLFCWYIRNSKYFSPSFMGPKEIYFSILSIKLISSNMLTWAN